MSGEYDDLEAVAGWLRAELHQPLDEPLAAAHVDAMRRAYRSAARGRGSRWNFVRGRVGALGTIAALLAGSGMAAAGALPAAAQHAVAVVAHDVGIALPDPTPHHTGRPASPGRSNDAPGQVHRPTAPGRSGSAPGHTGDIAGSTPPSVAGHGPVHGPHDTTTTSTESSTTTDTSGTTTTTSPGESHGGPPSSVPPNQGGNGNGNGNGNGAGHGQGNGNGNGSGHGGPGPSGP
jgi:hypothetical protein